MFINIEQLKKLSCISFSSSSEEQAFFAKFNSVVDFLSELRDLDVENVESKSDFSLRTLSKTDFLDNSLVLGNVKHQIISGGVVIKSFI